MKSDFGDYRQIFVENIFLMKNGNYTSAMEDFRIILYVSVYLCCCYINGADSKRVSCQKPPELENGFYRPNKQSFYNGISIRYRCNRGYKLRGGKRISCKLTGKWSSTPPKCEKDGKSDIKIQGCSVSRAPRNGYVDTKELTLVTNGTVVTYSCRTGYDLIGKAVLICENDGDFSGETPRCEKNGEHSGCKVPKAPTNGHGEYNYNDFVPYGDSIKYSCNEGYDIQGKSQIRCRKSGKFSYQVPTCKLSKAQDSGDSARSFQVEERHIKSFLRNSSSNICKTPSLLENGYVSSSGRYIREGGKVKYYCYKSYVLHGSNESVCRKDGTLQPDVPVCLKSSNKFERQKFCTVPELQDGVVKMSENGSIAYGKSVRFQCNRRFEMLGDPQAFCDKDGLLSPGVPKCLRFCKLPKLVEHGLVYGDYSDIVFAGGTVFFDCEQDFKLVGNDRAECLSTGKYDNSPPLCIKYECARPDISEYGRMIEDKQEYVPGEVVIFTCIDGFQLLGADSSVCQESGKFEPNPPVCRRIDAKYETSSSCIAPLDIPKGLKISPSKKRYNIGEQIGYSCNPGYQINGKTIAVCELDGRFHDKIPECEKKVGKKCTRPQFERRIRIYPDREEYNTGTKIKLRCYPSYLRIIGDESAACDEDGKFEFTSKPDCVFSFRLYAEREMHR
uniref:sushi, von Willebrand factor type A, EGF and pentraxin domain-containing protein 1-like isoform X1 n=2 Tax=Styela clava TaxID=7725 RepID=UPI00193933AE|nr:sushi, von Willebrand factor type A, EGF and pentraxin domain-containing protein 1-like isoform X1 [Styela clava]